jgi:hypothetical protein
MDKYRITEALGLPPDSPITLTALQPVLWGQDLLFEGRCADVAFRLDLLDCRDIRWQIYAHTQAVGRPAFPPAQVVNLSIGKDQHRSPLRMLTDYFGLIVSYGQLQIASADKLKC